MTLNAQKLEDTFTELENDKKQRNKLFVSFIA